MRLVASFLTAFAVLTPMAYAADTSVVSTSTQPAIPVEGRAFELLAGSTGPGVAYSWDLDGDGTYGDATGARVSQTWPHGTRTVSVRATDAAGRTSTEARSITAATLGGPEMTIWTTSRMEIDREYDVAARGSSRNGSIVKIEFDLNGDGTFASAGDFRNSWADEWVGVEKVSFHAPGDHLIRARLTDNKGVTAVGTITVRVVESDPAGYLNVHGGSFDQPAVAGQPATIEAYSRREAAKFEFDLDGDGVYDLDKGTTGTFQTTLSAGPHVVGVRMTDTRGGVIEQRITTFVYEPADSVPDKFFVRRFEMEAVAGKPIDLTATVEPYSYPYTVEWDADADGEFDDGTSTLKAGDMPDSSVAHTTFTYPSPGVYEERVRVSREGLPTGSSPRGSSSGPAMSTVRPTT
jgi:hypothetical protein